MFVLLLSLKFHGVAARVHVLGIGLSEQSKATLEQFEGVRVHDADPELPLVPCARKAEAILTAKDEETDFITLLDGDCIVTGDVSPYLAYDAPGLYARFRLPDEDSMVFASRYAPGESHHGIPASVLNEWKNDVSERTEAALYHTVCGGNLTVHRSYLPFVKRWHEQMLKVLPNLQHTHSMDSHAYFQMDEWVLCSLLAFANSPPPLYRGTLDRDPDAYVAHLGPADPKPWVLWRWDRMCYAQSVIDLVEWGRAQGYRIEHTPWTFRRKLLPFFVPASFLYHVYRGIRSRIGRLLRAAGLCPHRRQAMVREPS